MSRFRKCEPESGVHAKLVEVIESVFNSLEMLSIGLLFDTEKKMSKGKMRLAEIVKPHKLLSHYAKDASGIPYDFIMIIDEMAWNCMEEKDRTRLVRHELRHIGVNGKGNHVLVHHDFEDFYREVELNQDDPNWGFRVTEMAIQGYAEQKKKGKSKSRETISNTRFDLDSANGRGQRPLLQEL